MPASCGSVKLQSQDLSSFNKKDLLVSQHQSAARRWFGSQRPQSSHTIPADIQSGFTLGLTRQKSPTPPCAKQEHDDEQIKKIERYVNMIIIRRPQQTAGGARPRRNVVARSLAATVFWCCEQVAAGLANSKVWSSFLWISCGAQFLLDVLTCLGDRRKTYADVSKEEWSHEC